MLRSLRKILFVLGAFSSIACVFIGLSGSNVDETIVNNLRIQSSFDEARKFVESFAESNGRYPSSARFKTWASLQDHGAYGPRHVLYSTSNYSDEVLGMFSGTTSPSYVLSFWRGDLFEYLPSWSESSSMVFERSAYFILGSPLADAGGFAAVAALCFVISGLLTKHAE